MSFKEQVEKAFAKKEAEKRAQRLEALNAYFEQHLTDLPERSANFLRDINNGTITPENYHDSAKAHLGLCVPIEPYIDHASLTHEDIYGLSGFRKLHDLMRSEEYSVRLGVEFDSTLLKISIAPKLPYDESYLTLSGRSHDWVYGVEQYPVPPAETSPAPQAASVKVRTKPNPRRQHASRP